MTVFDPDEVAGINTPEDLQRAEAGIGRALQGFET
jgi:hypothetical protein